jgi:heptosyltransferase-2
MHIADALGTPIIALFGSTSEIITGPFRTGFVIHKPVECSPCYQRTCPIDFRCMKRIEAAEVFEAISQVLKKKKSKD